MFLKALLMKLFIPVFRVNSLSKQVTALPSEHSNSMSNFILMKEALAGKIRCFCGGILKMVS